MNPVWLPVVVAASRLGASLLTASLLTATPLRAESGFTSVLSADVDPITPIQYRRGSEPMAADDLSAALAARGYRNISPPRRKGGYYVVEATGRRGERTTIIVDVWTGEISGLRRRVD